MFSEVENFINEWLRAAYEFEDFLNVAMSSAAITHLGILDIGGTALGICNIYEQICSVYDSFCSKNNFIFLKYQFTILINNWICYNNDFTGSIT